MATLTDADKVLRNDVGKRMATALEAIAQGGGGGASVVQKTMAEYTALPSSEKMNGSIYKITDKALIYCLDEEYHAVKEITSADYALLTSDEKNNGTLYVITDEETTAADIPYSSGVSVADKLDNVPTFDTLTSSDNNKLLGVSVSGSDISVGAVDIETITITPKTNVTINDAQAFRVGRMCFLSFSFNTSVATNSICSVSVLPNNYVMVPLGVDGSNSGTSMGYITPSGNLSLNSNVIANKNYAVNVCYIANASQ